MLIRILAVLMLFATLPAQAATQFNEAQKQEIQNIVKEYLVANPQVMQDALGALQLKLQNDERDRQASSMAENRPKLQATTIAPAGGNAQGNATVVEFFDYRCGYCRSMTPVVEELIKADPQVKVVYREFPILGPVSVTAAKAALASAAQGKYLQFHAALMGGTRNLSSDDDVYGIATSVGLDLNRLKQDMESQTIKDEISSNFQLAESMGIRGTPAFVIGDQMYPGALDIGGLKSAVEQARNASKDQPAPAPAAANP